MRRRNGEWSRITPRGFDSAYFDKHGFREEFAAGKGSDLLFIEGIEMKAPYEGRNIELALVRRLCDTVGEGCELAVIEATTQAEAARWQRMGFELTQLGAAKTRGFIAAAEPVARAGGSAGDVLGEVPSDVLVVPPHPPVRRRAAG